MLFMLFQPFWIKVAGFVVEGWAFELNWGSRMLGLAWQCQLAGGGYDSNKLP